jgi:hypothetical protein
MAALQTVHGLKLYPGRGPLTVDGSRDLLSAPSYFTQDIDLNMKAGFFNHRQRLAGEESVKDRTAGSDRGDSRPPASGVYSDRKRRSSTAGPAADPCVSNRGIVCMKLHIVAAALLVTAASLATPHAARAQSTAPAPASCAPDGDLSFVCGLTSVEDFLPVDGGRWLVGGSLKEGSAGLYLIDTTAKTGKPVALSIAAKADPIYNCSPPDLKGLSTHGLEVTAEHGATATVYAINHGGRESVEVFHLNAAKGSAEWAGCVVLPPGANGNSIAALPKGAFVVTKFMDTSDKDAFQHILAGQINGVVYLWTPGKGFSEVPGTQFSGDNGILVSHDGKWLFVNAYGTREIFRVPLSGQGERASVKVDFNPDNLRWDPQGMILATGQFINPKSLTGPHGWATVRLDPQTLKVTPVVKEAGLKEFDDATSAVQVGQTLWFGTFRGDRVAYRAAP